MWQLEGEQEHKELLKFSLTPSTIANTAALIVIDFSQPWNLVTSLQRWLHILENRIVDVMKSLPPETASDLKKYGMNILRTQ